ncbi:hypothetical protein [Variovorax sp. OV700]|uniref:hypothetical protein n=1 Tax=Variovorax sp. OV700 TaxID=1882826 RepID=UPI000889DC42|nr:hypothetical protein [Variovorax sp. OV700]SDJ06849.1 hypothetical protein SAMN05444748_109206 [Variovorax sp. OV700]
MSTITTAITAEWMADKNNKFKAYNISPDALAMINRSETLKADMRAYAASDYTVAAEVNPRTGAGEYSTPMSKDFPGYLHIASDRFDTSEGTVSILAHELGHFRVEEPNAAIATARSNALTGKDKAAYESACHLTEGYAHYNEVKVRDEILETNRLAAELEQRPLTEQEVQLKSRWRGEGVYGSRGEGQDHLIARRISDAAREEPGHMTATQVMEAAAFALAQNNRGNITSNTRQTYGQFCDVEASRMLPRAAPVGAMGEAQRTPQTSSKELSPTDDLSAFLDRMLSADDATFRRMQQTLADLPPGREVIAEGIAEVDRQEQWVAQQQAQAQQQPAMEAPVMVMRH